MSAHSRDFRACLSAASFWKPQYLESSAWLEHAPFAFWIIDALKPRSIVELGTHSGFSYFAFCQAVQAARLETRCFAVDTWKGDEHAGFYGEEIFERVNRFNNLHYSAFSSLVRATFDDALPYFSDSSVDLLHIDGRHNYDDVKHDFESWVPKLSERAVVLIHDTNVRERGFGVFRFWRELVVRFPNFEFLHGHGLGILGCGPKMPAEIVSLCANSSHPDAPIGIRAAYSRLGASIRSDLEASLATTKLENSALVEGSLRLELESRDGEITRLGNEWKILNDAYANLNRELENRTSEGVKLGNEWTMLNDAHAALKRRSDVIEADLVVRNQRCAVLEGEIAERDSRIASLSNAIAESEKRIQALVQDNSRAVTDKERELHALQLDLEVRNQKHVALEGQIADRDARIANLSDAIAESDKRVQALVQDNSRAIIDRERELQELQFELTKMLRSRSWRATESVRRIRMSWSRVLSLGSKLRKLLRVRRELILRSGTRRIRASSLFDSAYYLTNYPDISAARIEPATHYLVHGWKEFRNPSAEFNTQSYLAANPDVLEAGVNPLIHYLRHGRKEGRSLRTGGHVPSASAAADSAASGLWVSDRADVDNAASSSAREDSSNSDRLDAEVQAIRASGLFDEAYYLSMYQELQPPPLDPIRHYCEHGWRQGRNPSGEFDTETYLKTHSDIRESGLNPFWHYVFAGAAEQRVALPGISTRYENDIRFGAVEDDVKLLAFYVSPDWVTLRNARPRFKGHSQPILPIEELGCYNPLDREILQMQARIAKNHGIGGFCFDLNVAPDTVIGNHPIGQLLANDDIEIQFCTQIAISPKCLLRTATELLVRVFADGRQIRIQNRPLLLVKVAENWSDACALLSQLRDLLAEQDGAVPFVIGSCAEPCEFGSEFAHLCDAMLDLPFNSISGETAGLDLIDKGGVATIPYGVVASNAVARINRTANSDRPLYHVVTMARDNTAGVSSRPLAYTRFHIRHYRRWLDAALASAKLIHQDDRRFVFVNAWNNWSEGLHLEPDSKLGFSRLNETTRALLNVESGLLMPKVSVIVPNYNHGSFLRRRLDSIYGQTYQNFEVLLLDDCSSDQSRSVLDAYAARHAEITRTFCNDRNSASAFRQWAEGIKHATGQLIWIAESDDFCDDRFLEVLVRSFDDEAVLLAYGNCVFVDKDEVPIPNEFERYMSDLECAEKWNGPYIETAHNEVGSALGIKNTIPNASGVLFRRPIDMPLLEDESWLSMRVAGDWVFYLHILRGGKIAYNPKAINFFRRYQGSAAQVTYKTEAFYREVGFAARTAAALYHVPSSVLDRNRRGYEWFYWQMIGKSHEEFARWYDYEAVLHAQHKRMPNIMISSLGFSPGGAEILPIRLANELKRHGYSVLFFNAAIIPHEDSIRRTLRADVPIVSADAKGMKNIISAFGIEALNSHQWHIQKYPVTVADVFDELRTHVASLHGQIEHSIAFEVTEEELRIADQKVTTWVYTAEKNLEPFLKFSLCERPSERFVKIPNGMQPPEIFVIPRTRMNIPQDAFVLCCVSRAILDKGWAEMIEAVDAARRLSGRDIRLILVGNGPVYDEYCRTGTPEFVHLAGFSENSVGYYAAADMGIMLSKFKSESFPLTIVDCLFAGKPYIASDIGDIRNMLTVGIDTAGSVIELHNWEIPVAKAAIEIAAFASDQQKYLNASTLVEAAASRYRIDGVASQYAKLFEAGRYSPRLSQRAIRDSISLCSS
jgi:glycosyltransferase involved in cell wall biosynthesis/predicted  nucleic acid-binding Zn-ribbon protein